MTATAGVTVRPLVLDCGVTSSAPFLVSLPLRCAESLHHSERLFAWPLTPVMVSCTTGLPPGLVDTRALQ